MLRAFFVVGMTREFDKGGELNIVAATCFRVSIGESFSADALGNHFGRR